MPDSIKCDKCDQEFTDEEAHKIHMNIDHGASEADSFQFTDSRNAVDEQEFVEDNGVRGYNPNPNAGLYDNKLFRTGSSTERTSQLGEAKQYWETHFDHISGNDYSCKYCNKHFSTIMNDPDQMMQHIGSAHGSFESKASESPFAIDDRVGHDVWTCPYCANIYDEGKKSKKLRGEGYYELDNEEDVENARRGMKMNVDQLNKSEKDDGTDMNFHQGFDWQEGKEGYGDLLQSQKRILDDFKSSHPNASSVDDVPYDIYEKLEQIKDSEFLWSAVDSYMWAGEAKPKMGNLSDVIAQINDKYGGEPEGGWTDDDKDLIKSLEESFDNDSIEDWEPDTQNIDQYWNEGGSGNPEDEELIFYGESKAKEDYDLLRLRIRDEFRRMEKEDKKKDAREDWEQYEDRDWKFRVIDWFNAMSDDKKFENGLPVKHWDDLGGSEHDIVYAKAKQFGFESYASEGFGDFHVLIVERSTGKVVEDMEAWDYTEAREIRRGALINLNHEEFKIIIRENGVSESKANEYSYPLTQYDKAELIDDPPMKSQLMDILWKFNDKSLIDKYNSIQRDYVFSNNTNLDSLFNQYGIEQSEAKNAIKAFFRWAENMWKSEEEYEKERKQKYGESYANEDWLSDHGYDSDDVHGTGFDRKYLFDDLPKDIQDELVSTYGVRSGWVRLTDSQKNRLSESKANESDGMQVDWWDSLSQDERSNWMNSFSMTPTDGSIYMDNYDEMDSSNQYYVKSLFRFVKDNTNNDLLGRRHDILDESKASEDDVNYNKADDQSIGFIEQQHTEPKEDKDKELDDVDISEESIDYVYPTKASEAKEKSYTTEAKMIEGLEEEYNDFEDSDEEMIEETITLRKLGGYSEESIAKELHITYGVSHDEALEKVYSVEVSNNDKVAQTFFGKMYKECTESEKAELRMYGGSN